MSIDENETLLQNKKRMKTPLHYTKLIYIQENIIEIYSEALTIGNYAIQKIRN